MNKAWIAILILAVAVGAYWLLKNQIATTPSPTQISPQNQPPSSDQFSTSKKSAHYESSTPEHGAILAGVPINAVINFNFDLAKGSEIKIDMSGKDYSVGEAIIDTNKLAIRRKMDQSSPHGIYTANYKACWADGSCHDGMFQFKIDRSTVSEFNDMTGKKEIMIDVKNFAFSPAKVKVSKGTRVTWANQDNVVHTVNTDSHPAHTYYLSQNSKDLNKGNSYAVTFNDPGIYLYHCTPHADSMHGQVLVE